VSGDGQQEAGTAAVQLDAGGSGCITLAQRSWVDAMRQRFGG
jgi:hypothetical protein